MEIIKLIIISQVLIIFKKYNVSINLSKGKFTDKLFPWFIKFSYFSKFRNCSICQSFSLYFKSLLDIFLKGIFLILSKKLLLIELDFRYGCLILKKIYIQ